MQRRYNNQSNNRNPEKEKLFAAAKSITGPNVATIPLVAHFFDCVTKYSDSLDVLSIIVDDPKLGEDFLRSAFSISAGGDIPTLLLFFDFLGQDRLSAGSVKLTRDACICAAFNTPGLLRALSTSLDSRSNADKLILAWFLVQVCLADAGARTDPRVLALARALRATNGSAIEAMINLILPLEGVSGRALDPRVSASLANARALEPQHDNDFPLDYRNIQIIPTAGEINADAASGTALVPRAGPADEAAILDRQFRLLREDMVAPILDEVKALKAAQQPQPAGHASRTAAQLKKRLFQGPVLVDVAVDERSACVLMLVPIPQHLTAKLSSMKAKERAEFCTEGPGRRILARDSLLLFLNENYSVRCTGRVVRNEKTEFLRHDGYFCVGVEFSGADLPDILTFVRFHKLPAMSVSSQPDKSDKPTHSQKDGKNAAVKIPPIIMHEEDPFAPYLYQTNSSVFSYEPVLRCLQDMVRIPFKNELVQQRPPQPLPVPIGLSGRARAAVAGDPNQREAVLSALKQRVCLIQGPPGTGKTYVGVQIVRALLDQLPSTPVETDEEKPEVRILCLCYTNHALDDFLLSLHEDGRVPLDDMVRLGSSIKIHDKLKSRTLNDAQGRFDRLQNRKFGIIKDAMEDLKRQIEDVKKVAKQTGRWNWSAANDFLSEPPRDAKMVEVFQQIQCPSIAVGRVERRPDALWEDWCRGKTMDGKGIWAMPLAARQSLVAEWQHRQAHPQFLRLAGLIMDHAAQVEALQLLRSEPKVPIAAAAKILGCTIVSAAKNRDILAQIRPNIVIVEEAGEILEASLLTCLGPSVKHLIMIGDHKQLRPKLECYRLRKESGQGINFDVSLFERLAVSGFPMITLNEQRRMRPEICDLIRLTTYPELKDHVSVKSRADVRGVSSNVIFIDHNHPEGADTANAVLDTSSKINAHEVGMVREIVRYFTRQGYQAADIVVLTPYLGQLALIQADLRKIKLEVDVNDLDRRDLQSADIDIGDNKDADSPVEERSLGVRVATVDNFQGEEAKIIIGSLVRCNERGEVGFVAGAERINVMMSRARDAFVLLGSTKTLCGRSRREGTADWPRIIEHLRERKQIFAGFPAVCLAHNARPQSVIDTPEKFAVHSPCGGCTRLCGVPLGSCQHGHPCTSFCHPVLDAKAHACIPCRARVQDVCKRGHEVDRECCETKSSKCSFKISAKCPAGLHSTEQFCHEAAPRACMPCKAIAKRVAKEAEKLAQEAVKQAAALAEEREKLMVGKSELQRAEQESEHVKQMERMKIEHELVREAVAEKKKPAHSDRRKSSNGAPLPPAAPQGHKADPKAPDMQVPDNLTPDYGTAKALRSTKGGKAPAQPEFRADEHNIKISSDSVLKQDTPVSKPAKPIKPSPPSPPLAVVPPPVPAVKSTETPVPPNSAPHDPVATGTRPVSTSGAIDRLKASLKYAESKDWLRLVALIELPSLPDGSSFADQFAVLALKAVGMIANAQIHTVNGAVAHIDALLNDKFEVLNNSCIPGTVEDSVVHLVHAVLKFAKFFFYAKDADLQLSAKRATEEFLFLVQLNVRQELFRALPSTWVAEAKKFTPNLDATSAPAPMFRDPNCAEARWDSCKRIFREEQAKKPKTGVKGPALTTPSESIDIMLKLTGLESVKQSVIDMYERISMSRLQGADGVGSSYNLRCDGNPGTGKTTVARLYASFLVEVGILPEAADIHETSGSRLLTDGVSGLIGTLEGMKADGGGVIFVDETYQLNPATDRDGREVLDFILTHAEKLKGEYGKIVWVFAGYASLMDKLYEHNPGLPSRFPHKLVFEDYTDAELLTIMQSLMQRGGKDISAPPKKVPTPAPAPAATVPMPNRPTYYSGYVQPQPDATDKWGNVWKWSVTTYTWEDSYNNVTGYGVNNLGTVSNPLVSRTGNVVWLYDDAKKHWFQQNQPTVTQTWYPGSSKPKPVEKPPQPFTADPKWVRVAIARLGRSRGKVGFGNARAVRILFDASHSRQTKRLSAIRRADSAALASVDLMEFLRDDLLGPKADAESLKSSCAAWKKLQAMTGLKEVKESLSKLVDLAVINSDLEDEEMPLRGVALNRIFLGNPGTGKTTVAALYGEILSHLGLLSKGDVKLKNASDFLGDVIGASETKTRSILADSEGCVLVIDEAYSLNPAPNRKGGGGLRGSPDPYKTGVVDTIVEQVQGRPGEDRAVIMLGYRNEMEDFLAAANPGLSRRFQMENAFEFKDYTDEQLVTILLGRCAELRVTINVSLAMYAVAQLARARSMPNFGNAGAVNNLLSTAVTNMGARKHLVEADFHIGGVVPVHVEESKIFDDLVGCDSVRADLKRLQSSIKLKIKQGKDINSSFETNYLFVGAPGTGKTTVARKMGKMFRSLKLLPTDEVVEIKAGDLTTGYLGQTAIKTEEVVRGAKGKVLFIDEAYQLNPGKGGHNYMQEAVDTIVQLLTSEELKGKLVVILAGYEDEIDRMLQEANPGLRSRFSRKLRFDNFSPQLVEDILRAGIKEEELVIGTKADEQLYRIAQELCQIYEFSNGRDAKALVTRICDVYAQRTEDLEDLPEVEVEDLELALQEMQQSRASSAKSAKKRATARQTAEQLPEQQPQVQSQFARPPPPPVKSTATAVAADIDDSESESESGEGDKRKDRGSDVIETGGGFSANSSTVFTETLQSLLDSHGLNNKNGVKQLTQLDLDDPYMIKLATQIAGLMNTDVETVRELLREWRRNQKYVAKKLIDMQKELEKAKQEKRQALLPIWRCAVCGRADLPYIFCYVSPFIVEYRLCDV